MLLILDGWGYREATEGNAIAQAKVPFWNALKDGEIFNTIQASGQCVGLRPGLMGNSEVGHMTLGAGRVIWQDITRIDRAIDDGSFFENPVLLRAAEHARKKGGALNLLGLISDGGVHSDEKHYFALIDFARQQGLKVKFHILTDGRDTPPNSGVGYVSRLVEKLEGVGTVGTLSGRYYGMDRDKRWERTGRYYGTLVRGEGIEATDPVATVKASYEAGKMDEFIEPHVFPGGGLEDGDALVCFNFRADRMRQLTAALQFSDFKEFDRKVQRDIFYCSMTRYQQDWDFPVLYTRDQHKMILGEVFAGHQIPQLRIAETEKYAHVTFFFNAGSDEEYPLEERILVPSPKVATYDLKPEMSAYEVTEKVLKAINSDRFGLVVMNLANPDMVGHSGIMDATKLACEAVDRCLTQVITTARKMGWNILITGDHGNAEQMVDEKSGMGHTYHTTNPVPLVLVSDHFKGCTLASGGAFKDVAPTMLHLAGIEKPPVMEGTSLLKE